MARWILLELIAVLLLPVQAQPPGGGENNVMEVLERTEAGEAARLNIDVVNMEIQQLMRFLSRETGLTILATQQDIQGKQLSLVNLRNVTLQEALDAINSGLMQFGLTMVKTDHLIIITTVQKAVRMRGPVFYGADPEQIPDTDEIRTQVLPLTYLDATRLADQLRNMVSESAVLFADETANSLVITDSSANIRRIATLLAPMDAEPESPLKIKVITLENTRVQEVQRALDDLFRAQTEAARLVRRAGRGHDPERFKRMLEKAATLGVDLTSGIVEIEANEDTNQLLVLASEENIQIIEKLVEQMDVRPAIQTEFRVFRLKYADATEVADNLQEILQGSPSGRSRRERWRPWWEERRGREGEAIGGIVGEIRVAADSRMNALIIASDPRNWSLLETLLQELDQPDQPENEIEVFFLKNADAATLVQQINELVQGQQQQQFRPWWWWEERGREQQREGVYGLRGQVNLTADQRLNAVIAATSPSNITVLRDLITRLDVSMPEQEWGTRIYQLKYADAENIANILNSVYQGQSQNQRGFGFFFFLPRLGSQRNQARGSLAGNVVAEAYPTLNAVIISTSTARNFELIEEFLQQLDVPTPEGQREVTFVVNLEYSNAEDLATLLNDLWQSEQQGGFNFARLVARGFRPEQNDINSLVGKVRVNYDPQTNSLIVTTRSRYVEDVRRVIEQLDVVRGQVLIDVTILEISLDDSTKLGLELALTENRLFGTDAFGKGRAPGSNPLRGEFQSDLGLAEELTGFSLTMATKEYLAFLHTMMRENKVRTITRVPLFARDNQTAVFTSGRDIPYLQSAQTSTFLEGQIFNFAFLQDIGINIRITPHIARRLGAEGNKKPTIGLDIEQITASNFIEFTSFNAPVTEESTISTYIDAEDGQTIVIGGMKKRKRQNIVEKVPILGDLPILGALFRRTEQATQESEIVIVIQPHIIDIGRQAEQGYRLEKIPSQQEMQKTLEKAKEELEVPNPNGQ